MARYYFKVRDEFQRILAENTIEEVDHLTACRSVAMALAVSIFNTKAPPSTSIELEDSSGTRVAVITLSVEI